MAVHVRDFCRAHLLAAAGFMAVLGRLEALIERVVALSIEQQDGHLVEHAAAVHRRALRRRLRDELLRHLVTVAALAAKERPTLGERLRLPGANATYEALLSRARQLLEQGRAERELLVRYGLAETLLDELAATVDELEASLTASSEARQGHVGARAELRAASDEVLQIVATLDGLNRYRFREQPSLLAAWASARKMVAGRRPAAAVAEPAASDGKEVKPAA
ncbi:MAG TPA: hypothetical protein VFS40_05145 [Gemmatimonadales bacterium]|nr:hypothetical protein [Gemmatimonadales bacterium]